MVTVDAGLVVGGCGDPSGRVGELFRSPSTSYANAVVRPSVRATAWGPDLPDEVVTDAVEGFSSVRVTLAAR
jgi:hypothetical protein